MNDWFEAEQRVERAHEMYEAGRWEDALRELRAAVDVNPYQAEWHFNMGLTLEAMGRFEDAAGCYRRALEQESDDPAILNHLGMACLRAGLAREAIEAYERSARIDRSDEDAYAHRIDAYRQLGDHDNAELMFHLTCQVNDAHPRAHLYMALSLLDRALPDRAIAYLNRVRRLDPRDPDIFAHLGEAYRMKGDLESARRAFVRQSRLDPHDPAALLDLGRVLAEMERPGEAAEKFRRAIDLDPRCADAHFELACLAINDGRLDAAQMSLESVLRLDGSSPLAHQKLAGIALRRGRVQESRRHLRAELSLREPDEPDEQADPDAAVELAGLLMESHMPREAVAVLRDITSAYPDDAESWHQLAAACFFAGDLQAGIRAARRALRCDAHHVPAMQNLALAHLRLGQLWRARYWLGRAAEADPHDLRTRRLRAQLFLASLRTAVAGLLGR